MSLVWREQLSVGNNVIDADHRHLIDIINRVGESLSTRNKAQLVAGFESLYRYSHEHFAREERIAKAAKYEQVPNLNKSHKALIEKLDQVKREIGEMGQGWSPETAEQFSALLRNWLVDHVIKEDLLMKPALQKHSPLFDPM